MITFRSLPSTPPRDLLVCALLFVTLSLVLAPRCEADDPTVQKGWIGDWVPARHPLVPPPGPAATPVVTTTANRGTDSPGTPDGHITVEVCAGPTGCRVSRQPERMMCVVNEVPVECKAAPATLVFPTQRKLRIYAADDGLPGAVPIPAREGSRIVGTYVRREVERGILVLVELKADGRFHVRFRDSSRHSSTVGGEADGTWAREGSSVILSREAGARLVFSVWGPDASSSFREETKLRAFSLARRTYLVSEPELDALREALASGEEPRRTLEGRFLLRYGDWHEPVPPDARLRPEAAAERSLGGR